MCRVCDDNKNKYASILDGEIASHKDRAEAAIISDLNQDISKINSYLAGIRVGLGLDLAFNPHNHSEYSVGDGISSPKKMVEASAKKGWGGMGLTDHGSMGGVYKAGGAAGAYKQARILKSKRSIVVEEIKRDDLIKGLKNGKISLMKKDFLSPIDSNMILNALEKDPYAVKEKLFYLHYNPLDIKKVSMYMASDIEVYAPFKVLSGCEFYVSWKKDKAKRYNHITLYALSQKAHETLVKLTTLGSVPSRRYISGGTIRPRIFMEDIEQALRLAPNDIVVTTGCPISITSEAIKNRDMERAREFYTWGKTHVPKGRFITELHFCDVSLDFDPSRDWVRGEGKYYSKALGAYVSRFLFERKEEALQYGNDFIDQTISSLLSLKEEFPLSLSEEMVIDQKLMGVEKTYEAMSQIVNPSQLISYLVNKSAREEKFSWASSSSFTHDVLEPIQSLIELSKRVIFSSLEEEGESYFKDHEDEDLEYKEGDEEKEAEHLKNMIFSLKPSSYYKSESGLRDKKSKKFKKSKKVNSKEISRSIDEDSLLLITKALEAFHGESSSKSKKVVAAYILTLTAILTSDKIKHRLSNKPINVRGLIISSLRGYQSSSLHHLAEDERLCYLDDDQYNFDHASYDLINSLIHIENHQDLAASIGEEDSLTKEWVKNSEGNWMIRVNKELVALSHEFDVPLMIATDSHMTDASEIMLQDIIIKGKNLRAWHMSRPYAVPRASSIMDYIEDTGRDFNEEVDYLENDGNNVYNMLDQKAITMSDILEAFGSSALLLSISKCVSNYKWEIDVPKIRYSSHKDYEEAKLLLTSGKLREFLPQKGSGYNWEFSDKCITMATALVVVSFFKAMREGVIPESDIYLERMLRELWLCQEADGAQLCDFFLTLAHPISEFRSEGISVGTGRGSAAGMLIAKVLKITLADPIAKDLLDARWMTAARKKGSSADIDVDVSDRMLAIVILARVCKESHLDSCEEEPMDFLEKEIIDGMFHSADAIKNIDQVKLFENGNLIDGKRITFNAPIFRVGTYGSLKRNSAVINIIKRLDTTPFEELDSFEVAPRQWREENMAHVSHLNEKELNHLYEEETHGKSLSILERLKKRRILLAARITKGMNAGQGLARLYNGDEKASFYGSVYGTVPEGWDTTMGVPTGSEEAATYFKKHPNLEKIVVKALNTIHSRGVHAGGVCMGRKALARVPLRSDLFGYVSQIDMKDIDKVNVLKFDFLGLETLNQISNTFKNMLSSLSFDDINSHPAKAAKLSFKDTVISCAVRGEIGNNITLSFDGQKNVEQVVRDWNVSHPDRPLKFIGNASYIHEAGSYTLSGGQDRRDFKWLPKEVYDRVMAGESTDYIIPYVPLSTPETANMIVNSRSMLFQIDSNVFNRGLYMLRLDEIMKKINEAGDPYSQKNDRLLDFVDAWVALFRPGPMSVSAEKSYNFRLMGMEENTVPHEWLRPYVKDTLGKIIYQEQVQFICKAAGGFTDAESDEIRRAMGKKNKEALEKLQAEKRCLEGMIAQGVPQETAKEIWNMILPFADYGFNKAHSNAYAGLTCVQAFQKGHYKEYFFGAIMGTVSKVKLAKFVEEIASEVKTPSVIYSEKNNWVVIDGYYYASLSSVEGLSEDIQERIISTKKALESKGLLSSTRYPTAKEWFIEFGVLTKKIAQTLSSSGLLRDFGSGDEISLAYHQALVEKLRPIPIKVKTRKSKQTKKKITVVESDGNNNDNLEKESLEYDLNSMEDLSFMQEFADSDANSLSQEVSSTHDDVPTSIAYHDIDTYPLKDSDKSSIEALKERGYEYVKDEHGNDLDIISAPSALRLAASTKVKGGGVRFLVESLNYIRSNKVSEHSKEEAAHLLKMMTSSRILNMSELRDGKLDSGFILPISEYDKNIRDWRINSYDIIGVIQGVGSEKRKKGDGVEPKISIVSEGITLSFKLHSSWLKPENHEALEDLEKTLKSEKMRGVFILQVYIGEFTNDLGKTTRYFRIMNMKKMELQGDKSLSDKAKENLSEIEIENKNVENQILAEMVLEGEKSESIIQNISQSTSSFEEKKVNNVDKKGFLDWL